jgi:hypothetical protein
MKKKRFADGGYTDQEASDLMHNNIVPKRESIRLTSDEPATPQSAADQAAEDAAVAREAMREARVSAPRVVAPRATAPAPRAVASAVEMGNPESYTAPRSTVAPVRTPAPSRGDYSRNGPIGDLIERAQEPKGTVTPRPRMVPSEATDGMTSRKPKPKLKPKGMSDSPYKKGGAVKASKRGDGIAQRGKTKGRLL